MSVLGDDLVARLGALERVGEHLRGAPSVGAFLARAADASARELGFDRAVVLTVDGGRLSAAETEALVSRPGDRLRRTLLAAPVTLAAGTEEHALVRRPRATRHKGASLPSALAETLGLEAYVLSPIVPESVAVALLVVDRSAPPPTEADVAMIDATAMVIALELSLLVQRTRVNELIAEVRQFSGVLVALGREIHQAPVTLPRDRGLGPAFRRAEGAPTASTTSLESLLSPAEARIAQLLTEGRSNREIAESLVLSPETVKSHVARILRKLGAANRAEAVSLYLRLSQG